MGSIRKAASGIALWTMVAACGQSDEVTNLAQGGSRHESPLAAEATLALQQAFARQFKNCDGTWTRIARTYYNPVYKEEIVKVSQFRGFNMGIEERVLTAADAANGVEFRGCVNWGEGAIFRSAGLVRNWGTGRPEFTGKEVPDIPGRVQFDWVQLSDMADDPNCADDAGDFPGGRRVLEKRNGEWDFSGAFEPGSRASLRVEGLQEVDCAALPG